MIVAGFAGLDYLHFAARLAPVAGLGLVVNYAVIGAPLPPPPRPAPPSPAPARPRHLAVAALWKSAAVSLGALAGFVAGFPTTSWPSPRAPSCSSPGASGPSASTPTSDWTMLSCSGPVRGRAGPPRSDGAAEAALRTLGPSRLGHPLVLTGSRSRSRTW